MNAVATLRRMLARRLKPAGLALVVGLFSGVLVHLLDRWTPEWVSDYALKLPIWVLAVAVIARQSSRVSSAMLRSVVFLLAAVIGYWMSASMTDSASGGASLGLVFLLAVTLGPLVAGAYWWASTDEPSSGVALGMAGVTVGGVAALCFLDRLINDFVRHGLNALDYGVPYQLIANLVVAIVIVLALPRQLAVRIAGAVATPLLIVPVFALTDAIATAATQV